MGEEKMRRKGRKRGGGIGFRGGEGKGACLYQSDGGDGHFPLVHWHSALDVYGPFAQDHEKAIGKVNEGMCMHVSMRLMDEEGGTRCMVDTDGNSTPSSLPP